MKCPFCSHLGDKVVDSRESKEGEVIRRRRECLDCGRETPGWTMARDQTGDGLYKRCGSESIGSPIGTSARQEPLRHQGELPMAA